MRRLMGLMAVAAAVVGFGTGCRSVTTQTVNPTTGATNTVTKRVPDVALMAGVAKSAAYLGTRVYLNGVAESKTLVPHPEARAQFETARSALAVLIAGGTFAPSDLSNALRSLPVKELKGADGSLVVDAAVSLWDAYGQQLASIDKAQVFGTYILPIATAILQGLNDALGPVQGVGTPGI